MTIGLYVAGALQDAPNLNAEESNSAPDPEPAALPTVTIERILNEAAKTAQARTLPEIEAILAEVYDPVYAAIPAYADFHYTVLGEYTELAGAALGEANAKLEEILFTGFENRLHQAGKQLDDAYYKAFVEALRQEVESELPDGSANVPIGPVTATILEDALGRAAVTAPVATVAAGLAGSGALKAATAAIAEKIAAKIAAKSAAKAAGKTGGIITGAGAGAALCSWSGPGAVVCGIAGGAIAWFAVDVVVLKIDEYFNRDEFEAELRRLVDADRTRKADALRKALADKGRRLSEHFAPRIEE